ncbi:hypothetical protein jhhlp_000360 [Lomentospora prolificans]|uniref:CBM6 domain-containing protein n=1 Tax=Lomentospora prolificans TaxID=41688 RepID=A0A2N3NKS3_9PEZI|nr:hypothetical protein jhhlp_000360 [Lomentospora prolificans]
MRPNSSFLLAFSAPALASLQIIPGATWTASDGRHIQAHGAGVIAENGTYYLIGEDKTDGTPFQNVNCYASTDLVRWDYVGALLSRTSSGDLGPDRIVERPKVIYNEATQKYVLWMHIDSRDYGDAKAGVATGDSVCGKYGKRLYHLLKSYSNIPLEYQGSVRPLGFQSRDMGLYKDDDGSAYLLTEDRQNGLRIDKLDSTYTKVESNVYTWSEKIESPAMVKVDGRYYMFGSHLTGWDPNDNVYSTSTSLSSGWSSWREFADDGANTYASQTTFILPYGDGNFMYLGDRWRSDSLFSSTYIWLPLTIGGPTSVSLKNKVNWVPNLLGGGVWTEGITETSYEGEAGQAGGAAKTVSCNDCSGGNAMGYIGGPDSGTLTISGITTQKAGTTTIRIRYANGDSSTRYANVRVNDRPAVKLAFLPSRGGVGSSTLVADLETSDNTIVFEGVDGGWGPDIDRLFVPVE